MTQSSKEKKNKDGGAIPAPGSRYPARPGSAGKKRPLSAAERKAAERKRRRGRGFVRKEFWVHPDGLKSIENMIKKHHTDYDFY